MSVIGFSVFGSSESQSRIRFDAAVSLYAARAGGKQYKPMIAVSFANIFRAGRAERWRVTLRGALHAPAKALKILHPGAILSAYR
jgi:hypothetical protein